MVVASSVAILCLTMIVSKATAQGELHQNNGENKGNLLVWHCQIKCQAFSSTSFGQNTCKNFVAKMLQNELHKQLMHALFHDFH